MNLIKPSFIEKGKRAMALFIIAALLISIHVSVPAKAAPLKEEVVYVRLNNDGSVDRVYVVNSFLLGKRKEILDYGNYTYVQNLSGNGVIKLENGAVRIKANGERLYYEGFLINPQLPWNISISYLLNGRKISPDELAGKSGHLTIKIKTGPNQLGNKDFFDSYALQFLITLKSSLCKNIIAEGGSVISTGSDKQVNYVVLSGKTALLELSADVENFEMPAMSIAGIRLDMDFDFEDVDMSDIKKLMDGIIDLDDGVQELLDGVFDTCEGVSELYDGTTKLCDGMEEFKDGLHDLLEGTGELEEGTSELKDGAAEMTDGAVELVDGATELVDGVYELDDGVGELADGIDELHDGVNDLLKGTRELHSGIREITESSEDLQTGAIQLASGASTAASGGLELAAGFLDYFDGIIAMANAQLDGSGLPELTRSNYIDVLEGALSCVYDSAISMSREMIEKAVETEVYATARQLVLGLILEEYGMTQEEYEELSKDPENIEMQERLEFIEQAVDAQLSTMQPELDERVEDIVSQQMEIIMAEIIEQVKKDPAAQQLLGLLEMLKSYDQLLVGLDDYVNGVDSLDTGARRLSSGISSFNDGLYQYRSGVNKYLDGMEEFYQGSHELVDGANKLKDGTIELLDGVIELKDGIVEFKDGMIELHDGVIELFDGIVELHDGVIEMYDGSLELNDGAIEISDGTGELLDGVTKLYDGVTELKDGTGELRRHTATLDSDIIDAIEDKMDELLGRGKPIKSFVSRKNSEISAVQFVMLTGGISIPEVETTVVEPEPQLTFWQRLVRLFGF